MDKNIAEQINELMLEYSAKLDQSVRLVMDNCAAQEFTDYRGAVGKIMGMMLVDIMNPIYKEHPDLKPANSYRCNEISLLPTNDA